MAPTRRQGLGPHVSARINLPPPGLVPVLVLLLLGTKLHSASAARIDTNFGEPAVGILLYRDAEGSVTPFCMDLSKRFSLPSYDIQNETYRGMVFRHANQSCALDLLRVSSGKHVFMLLPPEQAPCPFEDSLLQAVSARAHSIIISRMVENKVHAGYFKAGNNGTVPPQDIIVGVIKITTAENLMSISLGESASLWANGTGSRPGEAMAKIYRLKLDSLPPVVLIWITACTTVFLGALWSGSTKKLLLLTQYRRPTKERPINDDADQGGAEVAAACSSSTSLLQISPETAPAPEAPPKKHHKKRKDHEEQQENEQPKQPNLPVALNTLPSERHDDFSALLDEESVFSECPIDCQLMILFVLVLAMNLLVMYYFFSKMWYFLIGCITLGSMVCLVIIFDSLAFLIPCASLRLPNVAFPCFVRSMELRHHMIIWLGVAIPILWVTFHKNPHAWILQNFLGSSFAINILRCVQLPNFKIITWISVFMFFDDIFMVFITALLTKEMSVMESVAHGVKELPVLMRVPNFFYGDGTSCESYFMLGYGDIAVPGLAVAYCHSYDLIVKKGPWYCLLAIICYAAALVMAFTASHLMKMGQPALLYLVPGVILPVIMLAWCRGDLRDFWSGNFVPKKGLLSSRTDVCASSSEQFQMIQGRRLLYVTTPVFSWLVFPLPVSQKAYNALRN